MASSKKKKTKTFSSLASGSFPKEKATRRQRDDDDDDYGDDDDFMFDTKNEQLVLGQALNSEICRQVFVESCSHEDFLIGNHRVIAFCIMQAVMNNTQVTDDIFDIYRYDYPAEEDEDKKHGGIKYIAKLKQGYDDNLTTSTYKVHISKLKSDSVKYRIQSEYVKKMLRLVRDPSSSLHDITALNAEIENDISHTTDLERRGFKSMSELNKEHDDEVKKRNKGKFGSTGFLFLNKHLTEGFAPKRVSVLAGRPGMGKSTFVANSMVRLANQRNPVANCLFALEMDSVSMIDRLNAIETDIPLKKLIQRIDLSKDELKREAAAKRRRAEKNKIFICDDVRKSLYDIKRELKILKEKHGVSVCFIDLFMKLKKPNGMYNKSTADQYTEMLNEVQRIARELDVHICVVVQISRKPEARNDKRPILSDLKDSGGYEEVADLIMLFYREAYYLSKNVEEEFDIDVVEINIAKQRQGSTGVVEALFVGPTTKIKKLNDEDKDIFEKMVASKKPKEPGRKKQYDR